jgi:N-acetylmuramoyl-L-alanine amidase
MSVSCKKFKSQKSQSDLPNSFERRFTANLPFRSILSHQSILLCLAFLVLLFEHFGIISYGNANPTALKDFDKTIVLDPGHGGYNTGARGPEGTLEKNLTLALARLIASELEEKYNLVLSRSDDYWLDIPDRTAVANHSEADLFLSIHAGGSFHRKPSGIFIYYSQDIAQRALTLELPTTKQIEKNNAMKPWENIQEKHATASKNLAAHIQKSLRNHLKLMQCKVEGAPLIVLQGADMPAVLIEIGNLTNPTQEKKLLNPDVLADLAMFISMGIEDFFN